jgi:hypothetical protein
MKEVCVDEATYETSNKQTLMPNCIEVPVTRKEPVSKPYYTYNIARWVHKAEVSFPNEKITRMEDVKTLDSDHRYHAEQWRYWLIFDDGSTLDVGISDFEKYHNRIGSAITVKKYLFGLWTTIVS